MTSPKNTSGLLLKTPGKPKSYLRWSFPRCGSTKSVFKDSFNLPKAALFALRLLRNNTDLIQFIFPTIFHLSAVAETHVEGFLEFPHRLNDKLH